MKVLVVHALLLTFCLLQPTRTQEAEHKVLIAQTRAALPDLIIISAVLINAERGEFKVTVRNRGNGRAAACKLRLTIIEPYGKQLLKVVSAEQPPLEPQATVSLTLGARMSLPAMRYLIATDALNEVSETNERNNVYRGEISSY